MWAFGKARDGGRLGFDTRSMVAPGCAPGLQSECVWPWGATENMVWQMAPAVDLQAKSYTLRLTAVGMGELDGAAAPLFDRGEQQTWGFRGAHLNPLDLFLDPPRGFFLRTSIPFL